MGYGENALGGFDPNGGSELVVITKNSAESPEQQILTAIGSDDHKWIVFDKNDFKSDSDIAMYRLYCDDSAVRAALDNASKAECLDHKLWCSNRGDNSESCAAKFFNDNLNDGDLPIRNPMIASNTTIDGRGAKANFLFSGFKIGADSSGVSTYKANNVIVTNLKFYGIGHTEDHGLDPDMIRSTGESYDIWIHKNTFETTGDSAFDVKVGAHNITVSFNRLYDVKRAALHGSTDTVGQRPMNDNITSSIHHNAFITGPNSFDAAAQGLRRVPLLRQGASHMFQNFFMNYGAGAFASVRLGGTLRVDDTVFIGGSLIKADRGYSQSNLVKIATNYLVKSSEMKDGYFSTNGTLVSYSDDNCVLDTTYDTQQLPATMLGGAGRNLPQEYSQSSRDSMTKNFLPAGQNLIDYVNAVAGRDGEIPFNSPLAKTSTAILAQARRPCL